jgi:uncharacterized protein (DUF1778 family)
MARTGRPPKPSRLKKNERIPLSVSKEEKRQITDAAKLDQKDTAQWAREILLERARERIARG